MGNDEVDEAKDDTRTVWAFVVQAGRFLEPHLIAGGSQVVGC